MNIHKDSAGCVTENHILGKGFIVFDIIEGNDMGQMSYSMPQYQNNKCKILGGYWNYTVKNNKDEKVWEGWWNSNEEFDNTMIDLGMINKMDLEKELKELVTSEFSYDLSMYEDEGKKKVDELTENLLELFQSQKKELLTLFMKHIERDGAVSFRDYSWTIKTFEENNKSIL